MESRPSTDRRSTVNKIRPSRCDKGLRDVAKNFGECLLSSLQLVGTWWTTGLPSDGQQRFRLEVGAHTTQPPIFFSYYVCPSSSLLDIPTRAKHPVWFLFPFHRPARTLGPYLVSDLPTSGTHLLPCHYVVISDNERVSTNPRTLTSNKNGRESSFARNPTANTRLVNESLSRSIFRNRSHGTVDNLSMDAPSLIISLCFSSFFFSSLGFFCICICTDYRRIENVRCYGRDGRVAASWLADWFYCSTTTWSLVSLAVIVGSAAICCFE